MSLYSEKLATLKREFKQIKDSQRKPLKPNQKIIYDFVNGSIEICISLTLIDTGSGELS